MKYGLVTDEFGGIQGIVTLKDIMEGLIGQVPEVGEESEIIQREDGTWLVDGQYSFYDFWNISTWRICMPSMIIIP